MITKETCIDLLSHGYTFTNFEEWGISHEVQEQTEAYLDDVQTLENIYKKTSEQWTQYKAIKELSQDYISIVRVKNHYEPNEYWKRKYNRIIEYKEKIEYLEVDVENVLDYLNIQHSRGRCACPVHEGNDKTTFSFKGQIYKCFNCDAKGNGFQLALTLGLEKKQIKQLAN